MKRYVIRLPSGDTLLKTDDPCLAFKTVLKTKLRCFDRRKGKFMGKAVVEALYLMRCREGSHDVPVEE